MNSRSPERLSRPRAGRQRPPGLGIRGKPLGTSPSARTSSTMSPSTTSSASATTSRPSMRSSVERYQTPHLESRGAPSLRRSALRQGRRAGVRGPRRAPRSLPSRRSAPGCAPSTLQFARLVARGEILRWPLPSRSHPGLALSSSPEAATRTSSTMSLGRSFSGAPSQNDTSGFTRAGCHTVPVRKK
jgi:hypothetical protein